MRKFSKWALLIGAAAIAIAGGCAIHAAVTPPKPPPPVTGMPTLPEHNYDLEATLAAPFKADSKGARAFELKFLAVTPSPDPIRWRLDLYARDGTTSLRTLSGAAPLTAGTAAATVAFDGQDEKGRALAVGFYKVVLTANTPEVAVQSDTTIEIGAPPPPVMAPPSALDYTIVLGNLHSQTNHSDGGGAVATCASAQKPQSGALGPADAWEWARTHGLDVLVTSEHNHMYDGSDQTAPDADPAKIRATFAAGLQAAADYRAAHPGFAAVYATEWGIITNHGHINIFNPDALIGWESNTKGDLYGTYFVSRDDYKGLYSLMRQHGFVGQFNHPASNQFPIAGQKLAFDSDGDEVMALCEVANSSAFSHAIDESDNHMSHYESVWHSLLLRGYHLAPTSNQDNHCANWGSSFRNRTGILIRKDAPLTFESFLEAIRARRVFATEDKDSRLVLTTSGGHVMGERFENRGPLTLTAEYATRGARTASAVDFYQGAPGGARVTRLPGKDAIVTVTPEPGEHFYFARVLQDDGTTLWSAPVWVAEEAPLVDGGAPDGP